MEIERSQVTYTTSFSNLPGFVPVQEAMTHENPPPEVVYVPANRPRVVYVPAPLAPPPPSLAGKQPLFTH